MLYRQVELTSPAGDKEVWWLPDPHSRIRAGKRITRSIPKLLYRNEVEDWTITQACVTLPEESIPSGSRIATNFHREELPTYMSF